MKKFLWVLFLVLSSYVAQAQLNVTGPISAAGASCVQSTTCIVQQLFNSINLSTASETISTSGTWSGTLTVEGTNGPFPDPGTDVWSVLNLAPTNGGAAVTTFTANNTFQVSVAALTAVRIRAPAWTSGTAVVQLQASNAAFVGSGGVTASGAGANQAPLFSSPNQLSGFTLPAGSVYAGGVSGTPGAQTKQAIDTRDDTGINAGNFCGRVQDFETLFQSQMIDARGDKNTSAPITCGTTDFDAPGKGTNPVLFGPGGSVIQTDSGFHLGAFDAFIGVIGNVTGYSGSPSTSGTMFQNTANFPTTGTIKTSGTNALNSGTLTVNNTGTGNNLQLLPDDMLFLAGDTACGGVACTYIVTNCTALSDPPCVFVPGGASIGLSNCVATSGSYTLSTSNTQGLANGNTVLFTGLTHCPVLNNLQLIVSSVTANVSFVVSTGSATIASGAETGTAQIITAWSKIYDLVNGGAAVAVNIACAEFACTGGGLQSAPASGTVVTVWHPVVAGLETSMSNTSASPSFYGIRLSGIEITCNGSSGVGIAFSDIQGQENSRAEDWNSYNCGRGLYLRNPGNSGPWHNFNIGFSGDANCAAGSGAGVVPVEVSGNQTEISRATLNGNNCGVTKFPFGLFHITNLPIGGIAAPGGFDVHQIHGEGPPGSTIDLILADTITGGGAATSTGCFAAHEITGGPSGFPTTNSIHIGASFVGCADIWNIPPNNGVTNLVKDDVSSNSITKANNTSGLGFYFRDAGPNATGVFTNANVADVTNGWSVYNGTVSGIQGAATKIALNAGNGNIGLFGHLNQQTATGKYAGTCTMSAGTTCTFSIGAAYTSAPLAFASVQSAAPTTFQGSCALSGTTVTITASAINSNPWACLLIGNPN